MIVACVVVTELSVRKYYIESIAKRNGLRALRGVIMNNI